MSEEIKIQDNAFNIDRLFLHTMKKDWKKVVAIYQMYPGDAPEAKLTKSEETALHIVVSSYHANPKGDEKTPEEGIVEQLVESIPQRKKKEILGLTNGKGDTPLHLAAAIGSVSMCQCIADVDTKLIENRNLKGETPLFLAAHHGKMEAFTCLHKLYNGEKEPTDSLCRRKDGDTILHSAISGEYFDLAFHIIHDYKKLVNAVNHEGFLPLHILARKPSIFVSSSNFRLLDRFVYGWLIVNELKKKKPDSNNKTISPCCKVVAGYPENYETCMSIFALPWKAFKVIVPLGKDSCKGPCNFIADEENQTEKDEGDGSSKNFPSNYATAILFFKLLMNILLTMFGIGIWRIGKIKQKKEKHRWAVQIMEELINKEKSYKYDHNGLTPGNMPNGRVIPPSTPPNVEESTSGTEMQDQKERAESQPDKENTKKVDEKDQTADKEKDANKLTPVLLAAKMGITEMVKQILKTFPVAFQDLDENEKNVLLLAAESRQTEIYNLILKMKPPEFVLYQVDNKGNGATHLAANFMEHQPWRIPGAALQMQWEIKWYKHVKHTMPSQCFIQYNEKGETANEIFRKTHEELVKNGSDWLTKTSESCSLVAALIATVAFATATTVPGGVDQSNGRPVLENHPAFLVFSIMSIGALCFSVTALVFFLAILTSRCQQKDFKRDLPRKLLFGLSSLFTSIAAMLLSFCAGHFFLIKDQLQNAAFPIYTVACLPITFFAFAQLPLYFDLWWSITRKVPLRSYKVYYH